MEQLIEQMKVCQASTFAFYLKAHAFHWNVEGPNFPAYHKFFKSIYEDAFDAVDTLAEEIRALDAYAPGSFMRFTELSVVKDEVNIPPALSMVAKLQEDNQKLIGILTTAYELAEKNKKCGLSNILQDRIDKHNKTNWMLKATIK